MTRRVIVLAVTVLLAAGPAFAQSQPPTPEQFFGFPMGAERKLAGWDKIVEYFQAIDRASDRVVVQELGKTTMGKPYIMAIVSAPETIANLAAHQEQQKKLADPRKTTEEEAARIAREGKAVLLIGTNVHSTEIGNSQMVNRLIHKLATERSPWMDHVLKNVILLLIPSQNPDGQQMVVDWYAKNLGTAYEDSPLPELYHKYIGHDNNRDNYMLTQVETQYLTRVTYKDWLPEVYLDKHQMGSNRARIFVPPFKNPPNPNVDPLVWSEVNLLGQAMAAKLHEAGKTGVIWGEQYTGFWQGANSTNPWWHNMIALLTEVASSRLGTTLTQEMADPDRPPRTPADRGTGAPGPDEAGRRAAGGGFGAGDRDPNAPLPAPTDVQYRMNYTQPWLGGKWTLADVVDYQFISAIGLLEGVANNKEMLKRNFYVMNKRAIDLYAKGAPFAYVVPPDQRDAIAAVKLMQLVQAEAGEVHVAQAPFTADGKEYPAGTHVMLLAQPFGRWIKDLLEPQRYPDIRWPFASAPIDRPYDVSAWTLGMLMGVKTIKVDKPFEAKLALLTAEATARAGKINGSGNVYVFNHEVNNSLVATNRLLKDGADVGWAREALTVNGHRFSPGAIVVRGARRETIAKIAEELKLDVEATGTAPANLLAIRAPRLALFEPWGGNMDAGWTRWLLEQHEFPYTHARAADLRKADLDLPLRRHPVCRHVGGADRARPERGERASGVQGRNRRRGGPQPEGLRSGRRDRHHARKRRHVRDRAARRTGGERHRGRGRRHVLLPGVAPQDQRGHAAPDWLRDGRRGGRDVHQQRRLRDQAVVRQHHRRDRRALPAGAVAPKRVDHRRREAPRDGRGPGRRHGPRARDHAHVPRAEPRAALGHVQASLQFDLLRSRSRNTRDGRDVGRGPSEVDMRITLSLIVVSAALAGAQAPDPADFIIHNAKIYTVNTKQPRAEAIAIRGVRIAAVGSNADILAMKGSATRVIDAGGATIVPGLHDSHGHFTNFGASLQRLNLRGTTSAEQIAGMVKAAAAKARPGEWILGRSWDQNDWSDKTFPIAAVIDRAAPNNPVYLTRVDGHAGWANSNAMELAGLNKDTKDPPGGEIIRGRDGTPTGVLIDRAQGLVSGKIPDPTSEQLVDQMLLADRECRRLGLTMVHDAGTGGQNVDLYKKLIDEDKLQTRLYVMLRGSLDSLRPHFAKGPVKDYKDHRLAVRAIKIGVDGALGRTARRCSSLTAIVPRRRGY